MSSLSSLWMAWRIFNSIALKWNAFSQVDMAEVAAGREITKRTIEVEFTEPEKVNCYYCPPQKCNRECLIGQGGLSRPQDGSSSQPFISSRVMEAFLSDICLTARSTHRGGKAHQRLGPEEKPHQKQT